MRFSDFPRLGLICVAASLATLSLTACNPISSSKAAPPTSTASAGRYPAAAGSSVGSPAAASSDVNVVSDGKQVTGTITLSGLGLSQVELPGAVNVHTVDNGALHLDLRRRGGDVCGVRRIGCPVPVFRWLRRVDCNSCQRGLTSVVDGPATLEDRV